MIISLWKSVRRVGETMDGIAYFIHLNHLLQKLKVVNKKDQPRLLDVEYYVERVHAKLEEDSKKR